jgi:hypothetical protein
VPVGLRPTVHDVMLGRGNQFAVIWVIPLQTLYESNPQARG